MRFRRRIALLTVCIMLAFTLTGCEKGTLQASIAYLRLFGLAHGIVDGDGNVDLLRLGLAIKFGLHDPDLDPALEAAGMVQNLMKSEELYEEGMESGDSEKIRQAIKSRPNEYRYYGGLAVNDYLKLNPDLYATTQEALPEYHSNDLLRHPIVDAHQDLPAEWEESDQRAAAFGQEHRLKNLDHITGAVDHQMNTLQELIRENGGDMAHAELYLRILYMRRAVAQKRAQITRDPADTEAAQEASDEYNRYYPYFAGCYCRYREGGLS